MKLLNIVKIAFVASLISICAGQEWKPSQSDSNVLQIAVQFSNAPPKVAQYGTGFFVRSDGLIATAAHVYLAAMTGILEAHAGTLIGRRFSRESHDRSATTALELVSQDYIHDIVLLKLQTIDPSWQEVGGANPIALEKSSKLEDNTRVGMRGYFGADMLPMFFEGRICGTADMAPGDEELLVALFALPGDSGSPVMSMATGGVIGVVSSIVGTPLPFNPQQTHAGITRVEEVEHLNRLIDSLPK
jgi:V8-like Glu-specific endopeptidase